MSQPRNMDQPEKELGLSDFRNAPDDQGLSLEQLSESFSQLLSQGDEPYQHESTSDGPATDDASRTSSESVDHHGPTREGLASNDDQCSLTPGSILEAILFVGHPDHQPRTSQQIAALMRGVRTTEVDELVRELNSTYDEEGCPYYIESIGPGYRMTLRPTYSSLRDKFHAKIKETRLSQAAIDVLAIVAYNQPINRKQVDKLRGKPSGAILSQLVRRKLLRIDWQEEQVRTSEYSTTERFLEVFGLESLVELPRGQDLDARG